MDQEKTAKQVQDTLCEIAFKEATGTAMGYRVRCLELLAKMLGLFEGSSGDEPVTVVEDI